jgi:hypothetical protein
MNGIVEDLRLLANEADGPPPGLVEAVSRRYRRRRARRAGLSVACAAAAVAVAVAVPALLPGGAPAGRGSVAAIPSGPGIWRVPARGTVLPTLAQTWPSAVVSLPRPTPDGGTPSALGGLGHGRVLVASESQPVGQPETTNALYVYQPGSGYREVAEVTGVGAHPVRHWAVSASRLYWGVQADDGFDVYTAPLAGGTPTHLAFVPAPAAQQTTRAADGTRTGPWFATDDAVYWSGEQPGVMRLAATGGSVHPVAGFTDMYLLDAGSPWASKIVGGDPAPYVYGASWEETLDHSGVTTGMRDLLTGASIAVTAPRGATALRCAPDVCVCLLPASGAPSTPTDPVPTGIDPSNWRAAEPPVISFIQRPSGTDRVQLSSTLPMNDLYNVVTVDGRGLLVSGWITPSTERSGARLGWLVCDPVSGARGADRSAGVPLTAAVHAAVNDGALGYPVGADEPMTDFFLWGNVD